jgi:RimJ/RimL family protein N-acetyltransferase
MAMPDRWVRAGLTARRITADDLSFVHSMHTDSATMAPIGGVRDLDESIDYLRIAVEHWADHGVGMYLLFDGDRLAGRAGIKRDGDDIELAYTLVPTHWGRGLATAVASHLVRSAVVHRVPAERVVAYTRLDNAASRRVMDKIGLRLDAHVERNGHPCVKYSRSLHRP